MYLSMHCGVHDREGEAAVASPSRVHRAAVNIQGAHICPSSLAMLLQSSCYCISVNNSRDGPTQYRSIGSKYAV
jgi:hypothetical protein